MPSITTIIPYINFLTLLLYCKQSINLGRDIIIAILKYMSILAIIKVLIDIKLSANVNDAHVSHIYAPLSYPENRL